jgi:hypothetical protein
MRRESHQEVPTLSGGMKSWNPGSWMLPSSALSLTSVILYAAVVGYLSADPLGWALFRMPYVQPQYYFLAAAAIALFIGYHCLYRPGPWLPRIWLALLILSSLAMAIVATRADGDRTIVHAMALGSVTASISVLPRLYKLKPAEPMVQWIGLLVFVLLFPSGLGASYVITTRIVASEKRKVEDLADDYNKLKAKIEQAHVSDWTVLTYDPKQIAAHAEKIAPLTATVGPLPRNVLDGAEKLGKAEDITKAYFGALAALEQNMVEPVPGFPMPSGIDRQLPAWIPEQESNHDPARKALFSYLSSHAALQRQLNPGEGSGELFGRLSQHYAESARNTERYKNRLRESWSNYWLSFGLNAQTASFPDLLEDLLMRPVAAEGTSERRTAEAGRASRWLQLRYSEARALAAQRKNCRGTLAAFDESAGPQRYTLYCYGMLPEGNTARTAVILQLNYQSAGPYTVTDLSGELQKRWYALSLSERPTRVVYRFPNQDQAKSEPPLPILRRAIDKIYMVSATDDHQTGGFWFIDEGRRITVRPPKPSEKTADFVEYVATESRTPS